MTFERPPQRNPAQDRAIVPMINVVFLLLIFFLMSATLAPPDPFDITPPTSDGAETDRQPLTLHVSASGDFAYSGHEGEAIWPALATHEGALPLRVDTAFSAAELAALLPRLAEAGLTDIHLLTVRP